MSILFGFLTHEETFWKSGRKEVVNQIWDCNLLLISSVCYLPPFLVIYPNSISQQGKRIWHCIRSSLPMPYLLVLLLFYSHISILCVLLCQISLCEMVQIWVDQNKEKEDDILDLRGIYNLLGPQFHNIDFWVFHYSGPAIWFAKL